MGMYTEFHLNCYVDHRKFEDFLVLSWMVDKNTGLEPKELPNHPLFEGDSRWRWMLRDDSYYFRADTHSTLRFDDITKRWVLCVRCNLKNYDDEITKFLDWIAPYIEVYDENDPAFLGFYRYEETEWPILIHITRKNHVILYTPTD